MAPMVSRVVSFLMKPSPSQRSGGGSPNSSSSCHGQTRQVATGGWPAAVEGAEACARPASARAEWQGWGMGCGTCKSRYPAICSRKASSTSADHVRARRMPTGDALDSRCSAPATGLRRTEASAAAALLGPGMPPPCRPGDAPAPLCRPGDAALRGSCEPGSIEPAGSEAAIPPMLLSAIPLMPCRSSKGDEVSERIVAAPSGPLEGLNLPLSLRSGSGPAFASIVRFSAGPRRRDGGLTRSPSWRRGFVGWGGGAPEPLLLLLVLSSS